MMVWFGLFLYVSCAQKVRSDDSIETQDGGGSAPENPSSEEDTSLQEEPSEAVVAIATHYVEDAALNLDNPDRGLYASSYDLQIERGYDAFQIARDSGYRMVYAPIVLAEYRETAQLPQSLLTIIEANLAQARAAGVHIVLRVHYRNSGDELDASLSRISAHLTQLQPILQSYQDTISVVQAGVIGFWGEWHGCTGDFATDDPNHVQNRRWIVERWREILPERFVQIRTPMHKEQVFGASRSYGEATSQALVTETEAYSGNSIIANIGHHNDCFLASETDMGTYASSDIEFWQEYVRQESPFVPVGGETCVDDQRFTNCENARIELKRFGWSFLNDIYHPDVLNRWKEEGCYEEIKANLGYRFVALESRVSIEETGLTIALDVINKGYAAHYIQTPVALILVDSQDRQISMDIDVDIRRWSPDTPQTINAVFSAESVPPETYCVYLQIGNDDSAIRLSNASLWSEEHQANRLLCALTVE